MWYNGGMERERLFSVLPMSQRFSLEGGEVYHGSIKISNPAKSAGDFSYLVTVTPYSVVGNNYEADLTTQNLYTDLANWITLENPTGTISPNEVATINFTITVPEEVHGGGQYATIMVSSDPAVEEVEGIQVANRFQLASIIYADVSGEIKRDGEVTTNEIPEFSFGAPLTLGATIENRGNMHQDAYFKIIVTNAMTGEVIIDQEGSKESSVVSSEDGGGDEEAVSAIYKELIMPESTRYTTHEINNLPLVGVVKVNQTVYFNDVPYTAEKELLICPAWLIFIAFFILAAVIIGVVTGIRHRRKKKSRLANA